MKESIKYLPLLAKFIQREYPDTFNEKTAYAEAQAVLQCFTSYPYVFGRARYGLNVTLDRKQKKNIWMLYENVKNHSVFFDE